MKRKSRIMIVFIMLSLILGRSIAHAAETRIFVQFSIGGAAVIGGGILWWRFRHRARVSQNRQTSKPPDKHAIIPDYKNDWIKTISIHRKEGDNTLKPPPISFHIPFFVFKW